ncbi:hypothetical protein AFCDBAGC_1830 [Methylobacterium cerastii]|uniref:Uncharacterized protein n=1 Tax=Methylobacterium cerastii TaxID=932741 RepID=A0ABQ4QFD5_9HYPH|nr:hypothetical protein [Methylobacterium cerastii]GJD43968.1 hypothetical protein AFCDBAGC_1830 [Methylobacterium cerastii]
MRSIVRPQDDPTDAHAGQRDRAARLRDTAGRFTKSQNGAPSAPEPAALPAPQEAPSRGTVPVSADAPEGTYALEVTGEGLGLHADPGAALIVAPEMPTSAGLAVFYLQGKPGPVVFDLTHHFQPEFAKPFKAGSEVMPLIEVVEPSTGRFGHLSTDRVEQIHRVLGTYSDVDLPSKYGPRPPKLPVMSECPEDMGEQYVKDAGAYPLVRKGETVIFDPSRRDLVHGALCVIEWHGGTRDVVLTHFRKIGGQGEPQWWVDPVNRVGAGTVYASDGPYDADHLRQKLVGTVVGVLVPQRGGEPVPEAEGDAASEPAQSNPADEIHAAREREREAAALAALHDADLTSAVSPDVRAAIVRHGEVMQATQLRAGETDEEFDRDAAMQIEAEHAIADAPAQTLADLRAKLTYLLPLMADTIGDQMHTEHLNAIRDDADRLCRSAPLPVDGAADPVLAAIQAHSEARVAFNETCNPADEAWRREQGLDTSEPAVALAQAVWENAERAEVEAWNAVFETPPTTLAGLVAVICHAQRWAPENLGVTGTMTLGGILGSIASSAANLALFTPNADPAESDEAAQIRLAATPFTPSDLHGPCPVPSNADWIRDAGVTLPWLRHGFVMVCSSREQLTSFLRDQPEDEFSDLIGGLGVAQRNLAQMARLAGEALERIMIGMAILAEEERLSGKGGEV